jgi:hypothetical protein
MRSIPLPGKAGNVEQEKRDSFDQNIIELYRSVLLYRKIKSTLSPPDPQLAPEMAEQLQVAEILFDPEKDKDLTAEYSRFRELTKGTRYQTRGYPHGQCRLRKSSLFPRSLFENELMV